MYKGFLHTHVLAVVLFLIIYLIKTILLLANKNEILQRFSEKIKVPEMIISTLFLLTGIYLWINSGSIGGWFYVKLAAVFISIPIAIVAFKKSNKLLAVISIILIIYAYGVAETKSVFFRKNKNISAPPVDTSVTTDTDNIESIYLSQCVRCHGDDGKLGLSGSTDLSTSTIDKSTRIDIISNGKGLMPPFQNTLTEEQIIAVSEYIESFK